MRSLIIIEVEHGDTTDGVNEALFNMGIGSQFDPSKDDQWPTGSDGETWPMLEGMDYRITDYGVRIDVPGSIVIDVDIPDVPALRKACASEPKTYHMEVIE